VSGAPTRPAREDPVGQLANLGDRLHEYVSGRVQQGGGHGRVTRETSPCLRDDHRRADQLLLGAVVKVSFDLPTGRVGNLQQSGAAPAELIEQLLSIGDVAQIAGEQPRLSVIGPGDREFYRKLGTVCTLTDNLHPTSQN
jgi:hypothetical protein